jgi:hypothetical protein
MSHKGAPLLAKADIRMTALCQKQTCFVQAIEKFNHLGSRDPTYRLIAELGNNVATRTTFNATPRSQGYAMIAGNWFFDPGPDSPNWTRIG